jgi:hypothetical protein
VPKLKDDEFYADDEDDLAPGEERDPNELPISAEVLE